MDDICLKHEYHTSQYAQQFRKLDCPYCELADLRKRLGSATHTAFTRTIEIVAKETTNVQTHSATNLGLKIILELKAEMDKKGE